MKRNIRRGFTLAEVLVTVTITAVLAAVVVPSVVNQVKKGDQPSFTSEIQAIGTAVGQYATDNRAVPTTLGQLVSNLNNSDTWKGPYLSTGQDLSTTSSIYTAAAYGLTYADTIPSASPSVCNPDATYMPLAVTSINGTALASVDTGNTTFKELWHDMDKATGQATANVTAGPVQFTLSGANLSTLYICMIAAQVG